MCLISTQSPSPFYPDVNWGPMILLLLLHNPQRFQYNLTIVLGFSLFLKPPPRPPTPCHLFNLPSGPCSRTLHWSRLIRPLGFIPKLNQVAATWEPLLSGVTQGSQGMCVKQIVWNFFFSLAHSSSYDFCFSPPSFPSLFSPPLYIF